MQKYLKDTLGVAVPVEFIVPFSAKWALKSHLWSENLASMSDFEYFSILQVSRHIEPPKGLRVPNEHNKVLVLIGLKLFSKIGELEAKLYQILEYAITKCLNLIGQCEGSKSLRATVRGFYMTL